MKLATLCLTSCTGCHVSLLDLHEQLLELLALHELVFSPVLMDAKAPPPCDVALVEGTLRNAEDGEKVKRLRAQANILIALGTCAVYGGVAGLGNAFSAEELKGATFATGAERNPALTSRVRLVDTVVPVDYYIPGCPPPLDVMSQAFAQLLRGHLPATSNLPVCGECPRTVQGDFAPDLHRTYETEIDPQECLLQQGFICLGSVTLAGCHAACTRAGAPCLGCRGPTQRLITQMSHGIYDDWVKRRAHYLRQSEKEVSNHLPHLRERLYLYTLAAPFLQKRRTERMAGLIHRVNCDQTGGV